MVEARHGAAHPGAFGFFCGEIVGGMGIVAHEHQVEQAAMVAQAARPHALAVDALAIVQALAGVLAQHIVGIGAMLPMHKIPGAQNLAPGENVHGGGAHIIGIPDPDDVRVGIIGKNDGVFFTHGGSLCGQSFWHGFPARHGADA